LVKRPKSYLSFIKVIFEQHDINITPEMNKIIRLTGYLVNQKYMNEAEKLLKIKEDKNLISFIKSFDKGCNNYSHSHFNKIAKTALFKKLFFFFNSTLKEERAKLNVLKEQNLDNFNTEGLETENYTIAIKNLKKFKVMETNPDIYLKKIEEILSIVKPS